MRETGTAMVPYDSFWEHQRFGIDEVVEKWPKATTIINGNFCFDVRWTGRTKFGNRLYTSTRCHGRMVNSNRLNSKVSSDNTDTSLPQGEDEIGRPLSGSVYAGEEGKYIAMSKRGSFVMAKGRVPHPENAPQQALGGYHTNYESGNAYPALGQTEGIDGKLLFILVPKEGHNLNAQFAADAQASGVPNLQGGDADDLSLILGDGGSSLALAHRNPSGALTTVIKGEKHTYLGQWLYCINTYVAFQTRKPR